MRSRTTHLVLASILTFGAADAHGRRGFGPDCVDSLKSRDLFVGAQAIIVDDSARTTGEWVSNRHGGVRSANKVVTKGVEAVCTAEVKR